MLLAGIMIFTALIVAIPPLEAEAANSAESDNFVFGENIYAYDISSSKTAEAQFKEHFTDIDSAEELLQKELDGNMLISANSKDGNYTIYVNVYTGYMYYKNNLNGQILMSNYYRYNQSDRTGEGLFSQIILDYYEIGGGKGSYDSFNDAVKYNQISVTKITNGIRVNYTLGDTTVRYLAPGAISEEDYMNILVMPILQEYLAAVRQTVTTKKPDPDKPGEFDAESWRNFRNYYYGPYDKDNDTAIFPSEVNDAVLFFTNYLYYYTTRSTSDFVSGQDHLFTLAANVMGKSVTGTYKPGTEFVRSGAIDDFHSVFVTMAQLFNLDTVIEYCPTHKTGPIANRNTTTLEIERRDSCPHCGGEFTENTVAQYLFYNSDGSLNKNALNEYVDFIHQTITTVFKSGRPYYEGTGTYSFDNPLEDIFNPFNGSLIKGYTKSADGTHITINMTDDQSNNVKFVQLQNLIISKCLNNPDPSLRYSYNKMYQDEKKYGYVHKSTPRPVFRCALEYTFNDDGSLSIALPANSISFDESRYTLNSITPLKYFGSGRLDQTDYNGERSGYVFYPDASGTVMNFKDFKYNTKVEAPVYGADQAYSDVSKLVGSTKEQITMPVYGMVKTEATGQSNEALTGTQTLNNGFFSVIEDGASLATLKTEMRYGTNRYAIIYAVYQPYPTEAELDLSQSIGVSSGQTQRMVSDTKYNGTYKTRVSMLSDEKLNAATGVDNYVASYVGMAECYRDYLKANGTISALADLGNDLPLYIEAFGSMEITKKILSFPVEVSLELTTFENIRTMYDELADAKNIIYAKAAEYQQKADAEDKDIALKNLYEQKAASYLALGAKIDNITNVNFRLTGFANGGMEYTYPSKVKWDKAVGGKSGFEDLLSYSGEVASRDGSNLGIFPDFDFLYISNTSLFDGISNKKITSRLIDNRYATKQLYNSVTGDFEPLVTSVVSADAIASLYVKFNKDFADFNIKSISVSTLGSDVNSNFDDENPVNREQAVGYITNVLSSMRNDGYEIMVNRGNAYSLEYASHVIDAYIDSSHLSYASYSVPFFGMVFHGYVNYTGNALNYSGDPNYDILKSIESGASLYYILCYQNTEKLKEDINLNKYYGVSYENWFDKIVEQYAVINSAIGDLQTYEIVDHKILKVESLVNTAERNEAYKLLVTEFIDNVRAQITAEAYKIYEEVNQNGEFGKDVQVDIDVESIIDIAEAKLNLVDNKQVPDEYALTLKDTIRAYLAEVENEINEKFGIPAATNHEIIEFNTLEDYESKYNYVTDSSSTAGSDYVSTDYTLDNYNVVMVTYKCPTTGDEVKFVLNYNIGDVIVKLDGMEAFVLGKYAFKVIK